MPIVFASLDEGLNRPENGPAAKTPGLASAFHSSAVRRRARRRYQQYQLLAPGATPESTAAK